MRLATKATTNSIEKNIHSIISIPGFASHSICLIQRNTGFPKKTNSCQIIHYCFLFVTTFVSFLHFLFQQLRESEGEKEKHINKTVIKKKETTTERKDREKDKQDFRDCSKNEQKKIREHIYILVLRFLYIGSCFFLLSKCLFLCEC